MIFVIKYTCLLKLSVIPEHTGLRLKFMGFPVSLINDLNYMIVIQFSDFNKLYIMRKLRLK